MPEPEIRTRRRPPPFRRVAVARSSWLTKRMVRITLAGDELAGLVVAEPAASVRLVVPSPAGAPLTIPEWTGNEFRLAEGRRPALRTFTPRHLRDKELDIDIVVHGAGPVSSWAAAAQVGDPAAVSGTARGYTIEPTARRFVLGGDETAVPAIGQLLESIPASIPVEVHVELTDPAEQPPLPEHPAATITWHAAENDAPPGSALVAAILDVEIDDSTRVWVAGEAAAVQRVRRHYFEQRGISRRHASIRGYWKHGRAGGEDEG